VVRLTIVLVTSISWLALANHCELVAVIASAQEQSHSCCKSDKGVGTPAKDDRQSGSECCKELHPVVVSSDKKPISPDLSFVPHSYFVAPVVFPDAPQSADIAELDTGPPFASSFVETVLQRSILAHAPPCLI
jgi:hypothetical protein